MIEEYRIPVVDDNEGNTLFHAMAQSPYFLFYKTDDFKATDDFKNKWYILTYLSQFFPFVKLNQENGKRQTPFQIVIKKYPFKKSLCHIITYAHQQYFMETNKV